MTRFDFTADAPRVLDALCDEVRAGVDGDKLLAQVRVILYERRYVIPAPRTVGELAKHAREKVEHEVSGAIERTISPSTRACWVEQLFQLREDGMTLLEFLQEPPESLNTSSITRESEKVRALLELNVSAMPDLPGTERYWQMYATRMRNQRRSRFAQRHEPRRSIELVGFLRHSLGEHTDTLIRMVDRRVSHLWGHASKQAKSDQGALPALTVLLAGLRQTVTQSDQTKEQRFDAIVELVRRYDARNLKPQSIAARQRAILVEEIRKIRPLLKSLVGLDLHADHSSHWPALIAAWKDAYERGTDTLTALMALPNPRRGRRSRSMSRRSISATLPRCSSFGSFARRCGAVRSTFPRPADNETELLHLYAGILGQSMDLSANRLSLMVSLTPEGLAHAMHMLEDPAPVIRANEAVLSFMHSHAIARTWGSPFDSAADAMSLDMPDYFWFTNPAPKRRVSGTATYVHTHGWQGIFADRSIMITQRQPGPAIDGVLGQQLSKIARVYTDTHGYSAYGGSLGWTVGVLLCPRLKNHNDRRLHVPSSGIQISDNLKDVVLPDISLKSIEKGWAGHLKVADAVMSGRLSATTAIELQGAARDGDASFRAGHAHGLLLRTNDLLRFYTDPDYRREKLRYLNHNERTHQLQRQIRHAGSGSTRGRRQEELAGQSHCLALCTNLAMAYNTSALQRTLATWRKTSGREIDASIQRFISPMGFEHINFNGVIVFPFEHYRTQLLAPRRGLRAQSVRQ